MKLIEVKKKINKIELKGHGMVFNSGMVTIEWNGDITTRVTYDNLEDFKKINKNYKIVNYKTKELM